MKLEDNLRWKKSWSIVKLLLSSLTFNFLVRGILIFWFVFLFTSSVLISLKISWTIKSHYFIWLFIYCDKTKFYIESEYADVWLKWNLFAIIFFVFENWCCFNVLASDEHNTSFNQSKWWISMLNNFEFIFFSFLPV